MLTEALDHLVRGSVDHPDDVAVTTRQPRGRNARFAPRGDTLEVRVHPDDLGRVIGRAGRTA
ncbi:MAG: KH domain-containing protein, partial [Nocardioidaceae bacterium]